VSARLSALAGGTPPTSWAASPPGRRFDGPPPDPGAARSPSTRAPTLPRYLAPQTQACSDRARNTPVPRQQPRPRQPPRHPTPPRPTRRSRLPLGRRARHDDRRRRARRRPRTPSSPLRLASLARPARRNGRRRRASLTLAALPLHLRQPCHSTRARHRTPHGSSRRFSGRVPRRKRRARPVRRVRARRSPTGVWDLTTAVNIRQAAPPFVRGSRRASRAVAALALDELRAPLTNRHRRSLPRGFRSLTRTPRQAYRLSNRAPKKGDGRRAIP
jgi:hypothetical protein